MKKNLLYILSALLMLEWLIGLYFNVGDPVIHVLPILALIVFILQRMKSVPVVEAKKNTMTRPVPFGSIYIIYRVKNSNYIEYLHRVPEEIFKYEYKTEFKGCAAFPHEQAENIAKSFEGDILEYDNVEYLKEQQ